MWLDVDLPAKPELNDPVLLVAVSTSMAQYKAMYSQAREMADYMRTKMTFARIGSVRSSAFPPEVLVRSEGVATLPECSFEVHRAKRDVVLFSGDASPVDDQYEFAGALLDLAAKMGTKELYSVGARWTENPTPPEAEPALWGFATDLAGVEKLKANGVSILSEEPAPFFASLVVGLSGGRGIRGYKLSVDHGEASPYPRSVSKLLRALSGMIGFDVDLSGLEVQRPKERTDPPGFRSIYH